MHIPDGFLSFPVWTALDVAAVPAVAWAARQAQTDLEFPAESSPGSFDDRRIPLLGVMGAFVFAAQMINFPVGLGTSGHLVGGALLAIALGPAAAATVMTAVLILQAFLLQDGGVMALGANILNMAIAGVLAGYLPYRLWGRGRTRSAAIFLGGFLSVALSASMAMTELLTSGVLMPRRLLLISGFLFLANGLIEAARREDLSIAREYQAAHLPAVRADGLKRLPRVGFPQAHAAVAAAGCEPSSVGRKSDGPNAGNIRIVGAWRHVWPIHRNRDRAQQPPVIRVP